jgi:hypothetical protein
MIIHGTKVHTLSKYAFIMNRLLYLFFFLLVFSSCKKSTDNIIWERSYGPGTAMFIRSTPDSGIISCGETGGKQYFLYLDKNKRKITEYKSADRGSLSSAWCSNDCLITAGSTAGKMLLMRLDKEGGKLWDTTFTTTYSIDRTSLCYLGNGELLALGSASPDSSASGASGLFFVWFDTTGAINNRREIKEATFVSANDVIADNTGNIYLAITRKSTATKPKAGVAKYNNLLQKLWETDLYNNPGFGASSLGIEMDNTGNIYVSGKTELPVSTGTVNNSFLASLSGNGDVRWKKYLEYANSGSSLSIDDSGQLMMLNRNCLIINIINPNDGSTSGIIRTFNVCDSNHTDAFGLSIEMNYDDNILMAGSKGGGYYLAIKSSLSQSLI